MNHELAYNYPLSVAYRHVSPWWLRRAEQARQRGLTETEFVQRQASEHRYKAARAYHIMAEGEPEEPPT